jgi:hypothetical protein
MAWFFRRLFKIWKIMFVAIIGIIVIIGIILFNVFAGKKKSEGSKLGERKSM